MFDRTKLRRLRVEANLSQRELGEKAGIKAPENSISKYEGGQRVPKLGAVLRLAKALDVDESELQQPDADPITTQILRSLDLLTDAERARVLVAALSELERRGEQ